MNMLQIHINSPIFSEYRNTSSGIQFRNAHMPDKSKEKKTEIMAILRHITIYTH